MGMDLGRGNSGRTPFLVIGLLLICVVLVFNWWSLSTQNLELYRQLEERGEHLKIGSRKLIECNQLRQELEKELSLEKQAALEKVNQNEELKGKLQKVKEERDHNVDSYTHCNVELDSLKNVRLSQEVLIESRRVEKEQLESELKDKKAEITKLQAQLKEIQEKLDQKSIQSKDALGAPIKDDAIAINHENRNAVDARVAAAVNNAREPTEDTDNRETENNVEDPREKEQIEANEKTNDGVQSS